MELTMDREKFNKCLPFIFQHEGYRSEDKNDPGGLTIWGIASAFYPEEVKQMDKMTPEEAKKVASEIYYKNYWMPLNCDNYMDKHALIIFDTGVNMGTQIIKHWIEELGNQFTFEVLLLRRVKRYVDICNQNSTRKVFLLGWLNRCVDLWLYDFIGGDK
jgi:hypothetical protein